MILPNPVRRLFGLEPVYGGKRRSSKWPALRRRFLKEFPACVACGRTVNVVPHHIQPYHEFPERELDWDNLIPLCEGKTCNCHIVVGHNWDWRYWNAEVRHDAQWFREVLGRSQGNG